MEILGISILAIVAALGFEFIGHKVGPRGGGGGNPGGGGGKPSALVMTQYWMAGLCFMASGVFWSVAVWPLIDDFGWPWFAVAVVCAFAGLALGMAFDIGRDKKPDLIARLAFRLLPTLLLLTIANWATFTDTMGDLVGQYGSNMKKAGVESQEKAK